MDYLIDSSVVPLFKPVHGVLDFLLGERQAGIRSIYCSKDNCLAVQAGFDVNLLNCDGDAVFCMEYLEQHCPFFRGLNEGIGKNLSPDEFEGIIRCTYPNH